MLVEDLKCVRFFCFQRVHRMAMIPVTEMALPVTEMTLPVTEMTLPVTEYFMQI